MTNYYLQTKFCIVCGEPAEIFGGHVRLNYDTTIGAGFCSMECEEKIRWPSIHSSNPGYAGRWKPEMGLMIDDTENWDITIRVQKSGKEGKGGK